MYKHQDCIYATSFLLWLSILKYTGTVVWLLVILGTDTWKSALFPDSRKDSWHNLFHVGTLRDNGRGHHQIGMVLGIFFVQIPFPKHFFTPRTPYGHIRTGFWRFWIFPVCRLPSTFVRGYQGPVGFHLLDQLTTVWTVARVWSQTTCNIHPWCLGPFQDWHHASFKYCTTYMGTQVWALCSVQTNHPHFVGHVQPYIVALLWNPPENCGTLCIHRLWYQRFYAFLGFKDPT